MEATKQRKRKTVSVPEMAPAERDRRLRETEMLLSVTRRVAATDTLDDILETLVEIITAETGAERGSLFLNDSRTNELYSRVALGEYTREIRVMNTTGVAGHVYTAGVGIIVTDAYADEHFNAAVDEQGGFVTKSILCAPVKTVTGDVIGVAQTLNKLAGRFTKEDLALLEAMCTQASAALRSSQFVEQLERSRAQELEFLDVVSDVTTEIDISTLVRKVMSEATRMLNAERSTLFLNDDKTAELWSEVGEGLEATQIRLPNHVGIAGTVYTTGKSVNIPHAYADLRFNPAFDKQTGYFTRSILCVPVVNKDGKTIGVTQVLNKRGGPFTDEDESRLRAFTAQVSIGMENAKLFDDVQTMKNYNESMLESMSNGVLTLDEDGKIITCNSAGLKIMQVAPADILNRTAEAFFAGANDWILERVKRVEETQVVDVSMDAELEFGAFLSGLHPHPLGLEWAQPGYRGARHGCSRPRRSPIPAFATRVPATFPR